MIMKVCLMMLIKYMPIAMGQVLGETHNSHNCVADGGYQWCESTQSCVRPWETPCPRLVIDPPRPIVNDQSTTYCQNSPVQMCRMMCPIHTCPTGQCIMRNGNCCDMSCVNENYQPPRSQIPSNCLTWNDGCNTCSVTNGNLGACTRMLCLRTETPRCIRYNDPIQTSSTLQLGDICYRFCSDNSEPSIQRTNDCPVGSTCESPSSIGFDSCHDRAHRCIVGH